MIIRKNSIHKFLVVLLAGVMFLSCENKPVMETSYFNIDSVVDAQVVFLHDARALLVKQTSISDKRDSTIASVKDSLGWANELGVFRQLDVINKPINKGQYVVTDTNDVKSNLRVRTFTIKTDKADHSIRIVNTKEQPVQSLKVYYHNSYSNIRKVEGVYVESNYVFASSINLSMEFDNLYNKTTLTNYSITGSQKMFLGDSVNFAIRGKVKIN